MQVSEVNPYRPFAAPSADAPFAGRADALLRLRQHARESASGGALVILGRARTGKTALLLRCAAADDDSLVAVYTPLAAPPAEAAFLAALAQAAAAVLARRDFTLRHLPPLPPETSPLLREWFASEWLPEACLAVRPHRRLLWLVDDAHHLAAAASSELAPGLPAYLFDLLRRFPQARLALAVDDSAEPALPHLAPLAQREGAVRLANLDADAVRDLLRAPVEGLYTVTDDAAAAVYRETGGQPDLVQLAGLHLFERWHTQPDRTALTPEDVRALLPTLVAGADAFFREQWRAASYNEKLVLTALSGLIYDDPLRPLDAAAVESWLVETDYPLDTTAIHAALRALEYREVVAAVPGLTLRAGLLQAWLLDNARLDRGGAAASASAPGQRQRLAIALVIGLLVVGLLAALALSAAPRPSASGTSAPTVTLSGP